VPMKQLYLIAILLACATALNGQGRGMNAISTAGGSMETKGLVVSWTIGEDLIDFTGINTVIRQIPGYNPSVWEMKDGTLLKIYPTLTTGSITVEIRRTGQTDLKIELLDLKGSLLRVINTDADKLQIDLSNYVQDGYILRISNRIPSDQANVKITKI
jgi:hypothetical protein